MITTGKEFADLYGGNETGLIRFVHDLGAMSAAALSSNKALNEENKQLKEQIQQLKKEIQRIENIMEIKKWSMREEKNLKKKGSSIDRTKVGKKK